MEVLGEVDRGVDFTAFPDEKWTKIGSKQRGVKRGQKTLKKAKVDRQKLHHFYFKGVEPKFSSSKTQKVSKKTTFLGK